MTEDIGEMLRQMSVKADDIGEIYRIELNAVNARYQEDIAFFGIAKSELKDRFTPVMERHFREMGWPVDRYGDYIGPDRIALQQFAGGVYPGMYALWEMGTDSRDDISREYTWDDLLDIEADQKLADELADETLPEKTRRSRKEYLTF
jgi:hypothetical protein